MNKKALTVIIGFIAIALGIGYTLAACGLIEPFSIFVPGWWTVFLIVPGLVMLFSRDSNKFVSLCLITIGVVLFLQKNDLFLLLTFLLRLLCYLEQEYGFDYMLNYHNNLLRLQFDCILK